MVSANEIGQALIRANSLWLGYRYVIATFPQSFTGAGGFGSFESIAGIASLGVTEVDLPTVSVNLLKIPSLSTFERHIPNRISYSELVLRAPTFRNTAFWDKIQAQIKALSDPESYKGVPEVLVLAEYEQSITTDALPIAVFTFNGVQAISYTPAKANAQGTGTVPLEELRLQVDNMSRL